jgi:hypothetical protein
MESVMDETGLDFKMLAETMDNLRETLKVMVAGVVADGFTEPEARAIVAGMFASLTMTARGQDDESA